MKFLVCNGKRIVMIGLLLLLLASFLIVKNENVASIVAIYSYYTIIIGVMLEFLKYINGKDNEN